MTKDKKAILIASSIGVGILILILLFSSSSTTVTPPHEMETQELIDVLEEEEEEFQETPKSPRLDVAMELLHRHSNLEPDLRNNALFHTQRQISSSLKSSNPQEKHRAFKALVSYPSLQKGPQNQRETIEEAAESLNQKIGRPVFRVLKNGKELSIEADFKIQPMSSQ